MRSLRRCDARVTMTTLTTPERLAVLESLSVRIQSDVAEIGRDVKALARAQADLATNLATKTATIATNLAVSQSADSATGLARASNGVWIRAIVPWFISGVAAAIGILKLLGVF